MSRTPIAADVPMGTGASWKLAFISRLFAVLGLVAAACIPAPSAPTQQPAGQPRIVGAPSEIRVRLVTFLSGAASGPFGIPARTAAEVWVEKLNREGGIGGAQIKLIIVDENVRICRKTGGSSATSPLKIT